MLLAVRWRTAMHNNTTKYGNSICYQTGMKFPLGHRNDTKHLVLQWLSVICTRIFSNTIIAQDVLICSFHPQSEAEWIQPYNKPWKKEHSKNSARKPFIHTDFDQRLLRTMQKISKPTSDFAHVSMPFEAIKFNWLPVLLVSSYKEKITVH